jgi:hypothetical protein
VIDTSFSVGQLKSESNSSSINWDVRAAHTKINNRYLACILCEYAHNVCAPERGDVKRGEKTNYRDLFQPRDVYY